MKNTSDNVRFLNVKDKIKMSLIVIENNLEASGIDLIPFPQQDGESFDIPNASMLELLIKSRFENVKITQPFTLSKLPFLQIA